MEGCRHLVIDGDLFAALDIPNGKDAHHSLAERLSRALRVSASSDKQACISGSISLVHATAGPCISSSRKRAGRSG